MSKDHYRRRINRLEDALANLSPATSGINALVTPLKPSTTTPSQMEQVWAIAGDDIAAQVIRLAWHRRHFYDAVTRAIEILSNPADKALELSRISAPPYDPEGWKNQQVARRQQSYVPNGFKAWARTYLMTRLLGDDSGLALRHQMDEWFEGGDPLIDMDRFPHESIYDLLLPIDGDPALLFDARMLRLPHAELFRRIKDYPCWEAPESWDDPEGGHLWTPVDITGTERL
jgi:hypothetical protein